MRKLLYSSWQTVRIPFAFKTPIDQLYQPPPSPVPGDLERCPSHQQMFELHESRNSNICFERMNTIRLKGVLSYRVFRRYQPTQQSFYSQIFPTAHRFEPLFAGFESMKTLIINLDKNFWPKDMFTATRICTHVESTCSPNSSAPSRQWSFFSWFTQKGWIFEFWSSRCVVEV